MAPVAVPCPCESSVPEEDCCFFIGRGVLSLIAEVEGRLSPGGRQRTKDGPGAKSGAQTTEKN